MRTTSETKGMKEASKEPLMTPKRWVLVVVLGWIVLVSILHMWLNWRVFDAAGPGAYAGPRYRVGFLPVT
jgi:hypothetical protein